MKLKNLFLGVVATALMYSCGNSSDEGTSNVQEANTNPEVSYNLDAAQSNVFWKGTMIKLYSHSGNIKVNEGALVLKGDQVAGGKIVIDMTSIEPTDNGYSEENPKEKLVGHLQANDFFATDSFPTSTFVIKGTEGNTLVGDLTIRGITSEEKVTDVAVEVTEEGAVTAKGKLVFDRQKYNVKFSMGMQDKVLSDDIELDIALVGQK